MGPPFSNPFQSYPPPTTGQNDADGGGESGIDGLFRLWLESSKSDWGGDRSLSLVQEKTIKGKIKRKPSWVLTIWGYVVMQ